MKKFSENQVFTNFLKTHPRVRVDFHSGNAFYNENVKQGNNVDSGSVSLYQINVDRDSGNLVFPFINKDAAGNSFTVTTNAAYSAANPGETINGTYPLTSSITRQYEMSDTNKRALKNTLNHYTNLSPAYNYSNYELTGTNLISIPSIFYGETIKKGSVKLSCFYTGTLVAQAKDQGSNGALIQTFGTASLSGTIIGTVLYNEGFLLLTSSLPIATGALDFWDASSGQPKWTFFGPFTGSSNAPDSGSWVLEFEGTNTVPVMTMMCEAGTNEFNFSNNPTFITSGSADSAVSAKDFYSQGSGSLIKNTVKSYFVSGSEQYEPVTYISKVGIYDEDKNLIAIAKTARPVRKRTNDSYVFKIKLDL